MSTPNGVLSPPSRSERGSSNLSLGKRKRAENEGETKDKEPGKNASAGTNISAGKGLESFLKDTVILMRRHDTKPSILDFALPTQTDEDRTIKRTKLSEVAEPAEASSIVDRVNAGTYESVRDFMTDVETASSSILAHAQNKDGLMYGTRQSIQSAEDRQLVGHIMAFKKVINNLFLREYIQNPSALTSVLKEVREEDDQVMTNGILDKKNTLSSSDKYRESRTALTLYGSAPQPKQLFSSLQQPIQIRTEQRQNHSNTDAQSSSNAISTKSLSNKSISVFPSLREVGLPNGIATTQVVPVHSTSSITEHKRGPTLGDLFAPPSTIPQLNPPKQSKHTATRSSSVNWVNPAEATTTPKSNRRDVYIYTTEPQSTGQWLSYSTAPSPTQLSSPEAKRKQRDRTLSFGETKPALPQEVVAAHQQAKEEALFRSAYSSFAPSHDDAAAIVPECTKNRLWWKRTGEERFNSLLREDSVPGPVEQAESYGSIRHEGPDEESIFREAVDSWTPEELPAELMDKAGTETQRGDDDKNSDEILKEISELLETLHSYQRIRNLSLTSNARSTVGQNSQLTAMSGSPTSPSSAEFDVYSLLKSQLSLMISTLPPYAVAKLNGEQLASLNISTRIVVEGEEYSGTMEEDEFTTKARQASLSSTASTSARTQTPNMTHGSRSGQYPAQASVSAQYTQRGSYSTQGSGPRHSQSGPYHAQQPQAARPTSSSNHYPGASTTQKYPSQRSTSANTPHLTYSQQQYGQTTPQPTHPGPYGQNNHRQYFQQSTPHNNHSYHLNYPSQHQTAPQAPMQSQPYQQRPSQPGYQQRAQDSSAYNASMAAARSASPQKAHSYTPSSQRPSVSTPTQVPGTSNQRQQYFQQKNPTAPYASTPTTSTSVNGSALGASGFHTHMSAEQQAIMMDRQKAQLAQQNQVGLTTSRHSSGTPQPPPNMHFAAQGTGAHVPKQNGTMVGGGNGS